MEDKLIDFENELHNKYWLDTTFAKWLLGFIAGFSVAMGLCKLIN